MEFHYKLLLPTITTMYLLPATTTSNKHTNQSNESAYKYSTIICSFSRIKSVEYLCLTYLLVTLTPSHTKTTENAKKCRLYIHINVY